VWTAAAALEPRLAERPAVALVLGVAVLNESFTVVTAIGFALILAGSVLGTGRDRRPATTPVCAEP